MTDKQTWKQISVGEMCSIIYTTGLKKQAKLFLL